MGALNYYCNLRINMLCTSTLRKHPRALGTQAAIEVTNVKDVSLTLESGEAALLHVR